MSVQMRNTIAILTREVAWVRRQLAKIPLRPASGGGGDVTTGSLISIVDTFNDLPDPAVKGDAALGYTLDKDYFYGVRDGAWRVLHTFVQDATPSGIGVQEGDLWYDTDDNILYVQRGATAWIRVVIMNMATVKANLPVTVPDSSLGYTTDTNVLYVRAGGVWLSLSHSE